VECPLSRVPRGLVEAQEGIKNKMEQGQKREGQAEPLSHLEDCPVPGMVGYDSNVSPLSNRVLCHVCIV
jgi:hypothetical protein